MDERLKFVARRLAGEPMSELCREFGISRKTGYKIFDRYEHCGVQGLSDRSRRPYRYAHQLPFQVENYILNVKQEHPSWGARKIRERLRAQGTALSCAQRPNELWCTDYKGEFLLGNRQYCYPLTVTDHVSRYLLCCEALSSTCEQYAFTAFERLFQERGLPANIRSDNGVPFASAHALFHLSKLAVWWLRLGIGIERIQPGHPQQNGRHERMHLTPKKEATKPPAQNFLQQQVRFDAFMEVFNRERPHEALQMKCPAEVYQPSPRPYTGLPDIDYPFHDKVIVVTNLRLATFVGYPPALVQVIGTRLQEAKIWEGDEVHAEEWFDPQKGAITFMLDLGVAEGKMMRRWSQEGKQYVYRKTEIRGVSHFVV